MQRILIIQTAFIGDVVLATALIEKLAASIPDVKIDFLVRKGNEALLANNPHLNEIIIWNKKEKKYANLLAIYKKIRNTHYNKVINLQRFFSTGLLTGFSGANEKIGFDKNPLSFLFTTKVKHIFTTKPPYVHEVERNDNLIKAFTNQNYYRPKLYPSMADEQFANGYAQTPFITISPSSVWFTKQYPIERWAQLINSFPEKYKIYLLGGKDSKGTSDALMAQIKTKNIEDLSGKLSFLQSAALMRLAVMNYANDSAPLHFASAVNASVTAVFCSTVPAFGFTPLSDVSFIAEIDYNLYCRPCNLHGQKHCPQKHFKCALDIKTEQLLKPLSAVEHVAI